MGNNKLTADFPYYVGVNSLEEMANKSSRVCIMNILGNESSAVTPTSHVYSKGNVVAGIQYGRDGAHLETSIGNIPVFGSIRQVVKSGKEFDTGVIYLPPTAVNHAVAELCAENKSINKIVIVTEKISVRDARYIRWGCQQAKVDVFGANSLGIANSWDQVRIGGALGGDKPGESLKKGSVAIYSNSGNFSTTLSEYLKTSGFGTSTILSSGKDIYIHFALPEFLNAAENDPRTKIIVVYAEPGGYYEKQALDWIREGRYKLTKPIVCVISGKWKKNLSRAVGHAGALAGSGDDAEAKEKWFDDYFGVGEFNAEKPNVSERGVRVSNIQDVPIAVAEVMKKLGQKPDFDAIGDLSLKPWFVNEQGVEYPRQLIIKSVKAMSPYDEEIERANKQVGAQFIRESMRNRSGATYMDSKSQITHLHNHSLLHLVKYPFSAMNIFAVTKEIPTDSQLKIINPILNYFTSIGTVYAGLSTAARNNGATPNAYIGASLLTAGNNPLLRALKENTSKMIDLFFIEIGRNSHVNEDVIAKKLKENVAFEKTEIGPEDEKLAAHMQSLLKKHGEETIFTRYAEEYNASVKANKDRPNPLHLTISAILLGSSWKPLTDRLITRKDAEDLGVYLALNGVVVACSSIDSAKNSFWGELKALSNLSILDTEFGSSCFQILFNRKPSTDEELFAFNSVLNLTLTNGPGTISAKGAKESVSAENYLSTAYVGFMCNTGKTHGGNGFEAVDFLIKKFGEFDPYKEGQSAWNDKLKSLASDVATKYLDYKKAAKLRGEMEYEKIPCSNHPVFKGKPFNIDPREDYVRALFKDKKMVNPFLEFYHHLVEKLFEVGATKNVFCVNIDAVIATVSLELLWQQYKTGTIKEEEIQDIVFTMFLFGRMVGCSAEIADHRNRGTAMDCRTPASQITYAT